MESRDTIPFQILARRGPIDRGDGVTVTVMPEGWEAKYQIDGQTAAVAYVDPEGQPRVDLSMQQRCLGDTEVRRLIAVLVMASVHAHELSTLWHLGGPSHAG